MSRPSRLKSPSSRSKVVALALALSAACSSKKKEPAAEVAVDIDTTADRSGVPLCSPVQSLSPLDEPLWLRLFVGPGADVSTLAEQVTSARRILHRYGLHLEQVYSNALVVDTEVAIAGNAALLDRAAIEVSEVKDKGRALAAVVSRSALAPLQDLLEEHSAEEAGRDQRGVAWPRCLQGKSACSAPAPAGRPDAVAVSRYAAGVRWPLAAELGRLIRTSKTPTVLLSQSDLSMLPSYHKRTVLAHE